MFARPGLPSFEYLQAGSPDQVVGLLQQHGAGARLLMGGTDLFPALRDGRLQPHLLIDVKHLPGMRTIQFDPVDGLCVGAAVTMNELVRHPAVSGTGYALLAKAAATVASYQVRNRATLGGNLCNASPCADTSPAVLVLEGRVVLHGPAGERQVPAAQFFRGPGQTVMGPAEFLTAVRFPPPPKGFAGTYLKLGRCKSGDLALVGVVAAAYPVVRAEPTGASKDAGYHFRVALGSVAPVPLRATASEEHLNSHESPAAGFTRAAEMAMHAASPITDVRGGAAYQAAMVRTLTLRALRRVWALVGEGG